MLGSGLLLVRWASICRLLSDVLNRWRFLATFVLTPEPFGAVCPSSGFRGMTVVPIYEFAPTADLNRAGRLEDTRTVR